MTTDLVSTHVDCRGRPVEIRTDGLEHISRQHPEIRPRHIKQAIETADKRTEGKGRANREVLWARGVGPTMWLAVVVAYEGHAGRVVTAYGNTKGPQDRDLL